MPMKFDSAQSVSRRQILRYGAYAGLAAGTSTLLAACGKGRYRGPVRHVILISLDTARPDHFTCYQDSWIRTPSIASLARESIRFCDHITPVTTTLASHTSLFTGKYPHNHGVPRNGFIINPDNLTIPQILRSAGFHTAGILGSFSLDSRFGFARGFETFNQDFDILVGDSGADQNQRRAAQVTQAVIDHLDKRGVPRNLFLFVHYFDPHQPYTPIAPFDALYGGTSGISGPEAAGHPVLRYLRRPPAYEQAMLRYAREVTQMDSGIGRLLDYLKEKRILDEAITLVTSDHGENLSDAPGGRSMDHGWTVYEPEIQAVFLARLPGGAAAGTRCTVPTSHIDVLPMLTRYLGLSAPKGMNGEALDLHDLRPPVEPRILYSEATKPWKGVEDDPRWYNNRKPRCARSGRYKYIESPYLNTTELYDLTDDPREQRNLLVSPSPQQKETADQLRQAIKDWTAAARPLPSSFDPVQQQETMERLKSLGYL